MKAPEVKSTPENLKAAIAGETYERDTMYPGFIKQARVENNRDALQTFTYAKTAEAEHATPMGRPLPALLASWKGGEEDVLMSARSAPGKTTTNLNFEKCVSCFNPKEKYVVV